MVKSVRPRRQVLFKCAFHLGFGLVLFPLEYALYRIPVSPARHFRLRGNPELEVTFQYRQDHLETVLVEEHDSDIEKVPPHTLEEIGPHARKQFERIARQTQRAQNFESIASNDTGKDPETGAHLQNIGTEVIALDTYDPALDKLMSAAAKAGSVIECIDGCLWMGVYYLPSLQDEPWRNFRQDIAERGASGKFRVWNIQEASMHPRMQPIFLRGISPESILDILLGDALVLAYIDWDAFFQQANDRGINSRWTTRGERKGITETLGRQDQAFRRDGHTPVFGMGEVKYSPLGAAAQRIVVEGTSPRSSLL